MINTRPTPQPVSYEYASRLVEEGRRYMDHVQAFDGSSVDKNPNAGEVYVESPGRHGKNITAATFEGDRYDGTLHMNEDERGGALNRKYEFRDQEGYVTIRQELPSYGEERYDLYRIDTRYSKATVEHVWNHTHSG